MRRLPVLLACLVGLLLPACGGGGGGAGAEETRRTYVLPHVLESSGKGVSLVAGVDEDCDGRDDDCDGLYERLDGRDNDCDGARDDGLLAVFRQASSSVARVHAVHRGGERSAPLEASTTTTALVWDTAADLAWADLDRDGCPDLVVAGGAARQAGVWWGDPGREGRWGTPTILDVPASADRVDTGDVDGDGLPDVVFLDEATGTFCVAFQTAPRLMAPLKPHPTVVGACRGLEVTDVDGDSALDFVTTLPGPGGVAVCRGASSVPFLYVVPVPVSVTGRCRVCDANGDGCPDLLVVAEDGRQVACLLQDPADRGAFGSVSSALGVAIDEAGVHLWDCDDDGCVDLVTNPVYQESSNAGAMVLFGSREERGRFLPTPEPLAPPAGSPPTGGRLLGATSLGDDRLPDFLDTDDDGDGLWVLSVRPVAARPPVDMGLRSRGTCSDGTCALALGDLDGDGAIDLVTAGSAVEVRWQDRAAPATVAPPSSVAGGDGPWRSVVVADLDRDGLGEVIACATTHLRVWPHSPDAPRSFGKAVDLVPPGADLRWVAVGDVDGDGRLDLVACDAGDAAAGLSSRLLVWRDPLAGSAVAEAPITCPDPRCVVLADLNADGLLDAAVCDGTEDRAEVCVSDRSSVGPLKWMAPESIPLAGGARVAAADLDGDGRCDLVVGGDAGLRVCTCPSGTWVSGALIASYAVDSGPVSSFTVGDEDCDDAEDIAWTTSAGVLRCVEPDAGGAPSVVFDGVSALPPGVPAGRAACATADLDRDGQPEVVLAHGGGGGAAPEISVRGAPRGLVTDP